MVARLVQSANTLDPILVSLLEIVISVRLLHPEKALELIELTLFGISTLLKLIQSSNAP